MLIPDGYSDIPAGKLASVVTCLEMHAMPAKRGERADAPWRLRHVVVPQADWYRDLYSRVGSQWLWFSRLEMPIGQLEAILRDPKVDIYALEVDGRDEGLLELDFRDGNDCELAFFGLTDAVLGQGAGRWLLNRAIDNAWARPIARFWVHTCTLDHPAALDFYLRSGFTAYARRIEVEDDPRLTGTAPRTAAPHVPIIPVPEGRAR